MHRSKTCALLCAKSLRVQIFVRTFIPNSMVKSEKCTAGYTTISRPREDIVKTYKSLRWLSCFSSVRISLENICFSIEPNHYCYKCVTPLLSQFAKLSVFTSLAESEGFEPPATCRSFFTLIFSGSMLYNVVTPA